ncbi:MAG: hypothetical protein U0U69_05310 [Acidimicrobiia bacterium]
MDIHTLLAEPVDMDAVATFLDDLHHEGRVAAIRSIDGKEQARLFDAAKGFRKVTVDDFVPAGTPPTTEVIHWGRNSLPLFTTFQKRFCLPDDSDARAAGELWGFNFQPLSPLTGPGYFVCYDVEDGEVLIDYTRIPPRGAPGWPKVLRNDQRLGRFVYNGMQDLMRGVSNHVSIGRASRAGEPMPNWFVLCRQDRD